MREGAQVVFVLRRLAFLPLPRHFSRCGANLARKMHNETEQCMAVHGRANWQDTCKGSCTSFWAA